MIIYTRYTRVRGDRDEFCRLTVCPSCLSSSRRWCHLSRYSSKLVPSNVLAGFSGRYHNVHVFNGMKVCSRQRQLLPFIDVISSSFTKFLKATHLVHTIIQNYRPCGSKLTILKLKDFVAEHLELLVCIFYRYIIYGHVCWFKMFYIL